MHLYQHQSYLYLPTLTTVSVDDPVLIPDDEVGLDKIVESSDSNLDKVICFGSLCYVSLLDILLSTSISTVDVVIDGPIRHIDLGTL